MKWQDAVRKAIAGVCSAKSSPFFSRSDLLAHLDEIVRDTESTGRTPAQTLSRVLQELRGLGELDFLASGHYKVIGGELKLLLDTWKGAGR